MSGKREGLFRKLGRFVSAILLAAAFTGLLYYPLRDLRLDREAAEWRQQYEEGQEEPSEKGREGEGKMSSAVPAPPEAAKAPENLEEDPPAPADPYLRRTFDFAGLRRRNPEIVAWIAIPGTRIDYPVCQHVDDSYYLNHGPDGDRDVCGAIFLAAGSSWKDKNVLIYGHNMRSGRMFGELKGFEEASFWRAHPYVYLYTPEEACKARVFSCRITDYNGSAYETAWESEALYTAWLRSAGEDSLVEPEDLPRPQDASLTLSTCTSRVKTERRVVHASVVQTVCRE